MARGSQFLSLVTQLRSELRRSTSPAIGVSDLDSLKQTINRVYYTIYMEYDWPHLRKVFPKIDLQAGEQYYDFPTGLNPERVEHAAVYYSGEPHPISRGISFEEYAGYDTDEQSEPALAWDVRWTGSTEQIEIWPIPSSNDQDLKFIGIQDVTPLVNDADVCLLDDHLVVLFSAAELAAAQKSPDAPIKLQAAQSYFNTLKGRAQGGMKRYRNGMGSSTVRRPWQAIIRVS